MKKLTEGNIYKTFLLFAVPLILAGILSQAYNMIDTMIAGHFLGEEGLAAIGATSSLITFISSIFWGYIVGFGVYIARLFGAGQYERIRRGVWVHLMICSALTLLLAAIVFLFRGPIMEMLHVEEEIRAQATAYFTVYIFGLFLILLGTNGSILMNSLGVSSFPFYMSILSAVLNIGGNILAVTVLGMGVAGLAWATVFSAGVVAICYLWRFACCFRQLIPERKPMEWSLVESRVALPYSLSAMLQQTSMYCAGLVLSPMLNDTGSAALAAYVVTSQIVNIHATVYQSSSRTVSNYAAQCLGGSFPREEKLRMLRRGVRVGFLQGIAFVLLVLIPCMLFPKAISTMFFSAEDATGEGVAIAVRFMRIYLPFILFNLVNNLFHSFFRGVMAMRLLVICTVVASVVRIAVSYPLTAWKGIDGFFMGMVISWIAEALLAVILYKSRVWTREVAN